MADENTDLGEQVATKQKPFAESFAWERSFMNFRFRLAAGFTLLALFLSSEAVWAQGSCDGCCKLFNECQDDRRFAVYTFTGFDSWRGVADGSYQNNNGLHTGLNLGGAIPRFEDTGLAWQLGGSFGVYDWNGRESSFNEFAATQQQSFVTAGIFRRAHESSAWSGGLVVDQMVANNFGVFANEPYLCQLRYQLAYAVNCRNELGIWGTQQLNHSTQNVLGVPVTTRAVNQLNFFWHHKFDLGADSSFYVGLPTNDRVSLPGSLGNFIFGGTFNIPLNDRLAAYTNVAYMSPSSSVQPKGNGDREDSFNLTIGVAFYPGRNARSRTVAGRTWMPYLPVANNGTFFVDQDSTL